MPERTFFNFYVLLIFILSGCGSQAPVGNQVVKENKYDSRYPSSDVSKELEAVTRSVTKIYCIAYYRTYYFAASARFTQLDIPGFSFRDHDSSMVESHESTTGTGLILHGNENRVCILTCAHILNWPDTLISFYDHPGTTSTEYIKTISFKVRQEIYARNLPMCGILNVLAMDSSKDIALLGKSCEGMTAPVPAFAFPPGKARDLGWGSFVYVIGYPAGTLMVTQGIISNPNSDEQGTFMIDALFNRGSSGSIVLAIRNGVPNFELVGMVRSSSSDKKYILKPEKEPYEGAYSLSEPYSGNIRVGTDENINYGVTYSVAIETINEFYRQNRDILLKTGYDLDYFFGPK